MILSRVRRIECHKALRAKDVAVRLRYKVDGLAVVVRLEKAVRADCALLGPSHITIGAGKKRKREVRKNTNDERVNLAPWRGFDFMTSKVQIKDK